MKINNRFEIIKSKSTYKVNEYKGGISPITGKVGTTPSKSWHGTLKQACYYVLNNSIDTTSVATVLNSLNKAKNDICNALNSTQNTSQKCDYDILPIENHVQPKEALSAS
ncbi:MAG: hypothetical protein GY756_04060 [bacterium]|nr:hypothetical protein [bacterium]